jgi:hypothetical protein
MRSSGWKRQEARSVNATSPRLPVGSLLLGLNQVNQMIDESPTTGKQTSKFPPGSRLDVLGAITFAHENGVYWAIIDVGHHTGETLSIPAESLDTYQSARRELLKRHAAQLVLWEVENCRRTCQAREEWHDAVYQAIARGRE